MIMTDQVRPIHLIPPETVLRDKRVICMKCGEVIYDLSIKHVWDTLFTRKEKVYNEHVWNCQVIGKGNECPE